MLYTPNPVYASSENYKILLYDESVTVLDDLSVQVLLNYEFMPLIEQGYYYNTWHINLHTAKADRISVENEYGPLNFEKIVEGNWTLLTIDLGRKVYRNQICVLRISYFAYDRIKVIGPQKTIGMWTVTDNVYKENVTLTVNFPKKYGLIKYEPAFLNKRESTNRTILSGQMLGIGNDDKYYLRVKFADTLVHYNVTYKYTFTNEGSKTEDVFEYEVIGPFERGMQEVLQIFCIPTPVSISYDESGNPRYKFKIRSIASGGQTTMTMNLLIKIRLSPDYNESSSEQLDKIPSTLLKYTTADEYWEVDNPTINSLSKNLTEGQTGVLNKVKAIYNFVVDNVEYDYSKLEKQASERERYGAIKTYTLGKGVCGDFADLFVTLCRSSGIPAIVVKGFIYDRDGLFPQEENGHAWTEVFIPEYGWLPVDPTWALFGSLEGRHISELLKRDSSEPTQIQWRASEPFSYEMKYDVSLLETGGIFIPDLSVSASYDDEISFDNDVNLRLIIQNSGNGTAYSTNVTVNVPDWLMVLNESKYSLGKLYGFGSKDLSIFFRANSLGNASIEVSVKYQTNEGGTEIQQYSYNISITKALTTVSCRISPSEIIMADNITIQGLIVPSCPDKNVLLTFIKPDGEAITRSVITRLDGSYYFSFNPDGIGSWKVNASWEGDSTYIGATSQTVEFTVVPVQHIIIFVKDFDGLPISGAYVTSTAQPGGQVTLSGNIGPDGSLLFNDVKMGSYSFLSSADGYISNTDSLEVLMGEITEKTILLEEKSSGLKGIPGFPNSSIFLGYILAVIYLGYAYQRARRSMHYFL